MLKANRKEKSHIAGTLYGTTALEELLPPSTEGLYLIEFWLFSTRGRVMGD